MDLVSVILFFDALIDRMLSTTNSNAIVYKANQYTATIRWLVTQLAQNLTNTLQNNINNIQNEYTNADWEPVVIEKNATISGYTNILTISGGSTGKNLYISEIQYCAPLGTQIHMQIEQIAPIAPTADGLLCDLSTTGYNTQGGYSLSVSGSDLITHYANDSLPINQGFQIPTGYTFYLSVYDIGSTLTGHIPAVAIHGKMRSI